METYQGEESDDIGVVQISPSKHDPINQHRNSHYHNVQNSQNRHKLGGRRNPRKIINDCDWPIDICLVNILGSEISKEHGTKVESERNSGCGAHCCISVSVRVIKPCTVGENVSCIEVIQSEICSDRALSGLNTWSWFQSGYIKLYRRG